eukprot:4830787-Pleurochrysis_carterae.AAC.1
MASVAAMQAESAEQSQMAASLSELATMRATLSDGELVTHTTLAPAHHTTHHTTHHAHHAPSHAPLHAAPRAAHDLSPIATGAASLACAPASSTDDSPRAATSLSHMRSLEADLKLSQGAPLRVFVGTWNMNGRQCNDQDIASWLALPTHESPPDVVALGCQARAHRCWRERGNRIGEHAARERRPSAHEKTRERTRALTNARALVYVRACKPTRTRKRARADPRVLFGPSRNVLWMRWLQFPRLMLHHDTRHLEQHSNRSMTASPIIPAT